MLATMPSSNTGSKLFPVGRPNRLGSEYKRYNVAMPRELVARLWAEAAKRQEGISEVVRLLLVERLDQIDTERQDSVE